MDILIMGCGMKYKIHLSNFYTLTLGESWCVSCTCGWLSKNHADFSSAQAVFDEHLVSVGGSYEMNSKQIEPADGTVMLDKEGVAWQRSGRFWYCRYSGAGTPWNILNENSSPFILLVPKQASHQSVEDIFNQEIITAENNIESSVFIEWLTNLRNRVLEEIDKT